MIRLFLALVFGSIFALCTHQLYERHIEESLILPVDLVRQAEWLASQERWAESQMLAEFVLAHPQAGDATRAGELAAQADEQIHSLLGNARRFAEGAITGEPSDTASLLGSLSLDLFVVGDVRDLLVQGWKEWRYDDGDTIILALSAVGLATTLAPQIDWAPALLKAFRRLGALSAAFARRLTAMSRRALRTGNVNPLTKVVDDFGTAAQHLGPGPLAGIMKHIDEPETLSSIATAAKVDAGGTYVLVSAYGSKGTKMIERSAGNVTPLVRSLKAGGRLTKFTHKALGALPSPWLAALAVTSLLALAVTVPGVARLAARLSPRRVTSRAAGESGGSQGARRHPWADSAPQTRFHSEP